MVEMKILPVVRQLLPIALPQVETFSRPHSHNEKKIGRSTESNASLIGGYRSSAGIAVFIMMNNVIFCFIFK